jgi:ubiquinone/menaquinone biosynthesis C-methylase UbiE
MNDFIKTFWERQGNTHGMSHKSSWGDLWAIELEIDTIGKYIKPADEVLDVGCGNGFSLFRQFQKHPDASFTGVDYAESLIASANAFRQQNGLEARTRFFLGSVLDLDFGDHSFDLIYTTRLIINLSNWDDQQRAIDQCLRVARPGGTVILSEAFAEPLCLLNAIRLLLKLPPLYEHDFNRYLKKQKLESYLKDKRLDFKVEEFSSLYYLGSRVLQELLLDVMPPYGDYGSPVNKAFFELEQQFSGGGFGVQQAYVIKKPD